MGGTASIRCSKTRLSWTFAAVSRMASGTPWPSVMTWRFDPALPRSVGLGPVRSPPFWQAWTRCPSRLGSSQLHLLALGGRVAHGGAAPRRRLPATRADDASKSCPSRSPSPEGASPRPSLPSAQKGCRSAPPDPAPGGGHPWAWGAPPAEAVRSLPRGHLEEDVSPYRLNQHRALSVPGSVRHRKRHCSQVWLLSA
jgi:hypothetical protein